MPKPAIEIHAVPHRELTNEQLAQLRRLFDHEYLADYGDWNPELPYGYAPHDLHLLANAGSTVVGHVGWAKRITTVGGQPVTVAGVGGVLVSPTVRGQQLGQRLMEAARVSMLDDPSIDYGYLGCDESVTSFYSSCGWQRISAPERWINRDGNVVDSPAGHPLFILPIHKTTDTWPTGRVDVNGRPW